MVYLKGIVHEGWYMVQESKLLYDYIIMVQYGFNIINIGYARMIQAPCSTVLEAPLIYDKIFFGKTVCNFLRPLFFDSLFDDGKVQTSLESAQY